jgi:3-hydroxyacyl-[acyl-carrier-protein] dehydratase
MPNEIPAVDISVLSNLKQRFPMLMVDKVLSWEKGRELKAIKNISVNEIHFQGHFPGFPIFPGVLTIECFAQAAGLLISLSREKSLPPGVFDAIGTVLDFHFMKPLFPGEQMETHVTITKTVGTNRIVEGKCFVNGEIVASGKLMFGEIILPC